MRHLLRDLRTTLWKVSPYWACSLFVPRLKEVQEGGDIELPVIYCGVPGPPHICFLVVTFSHTSLPCLVCQHVEC